MFLNRTSCHKIPHANDYHGARPAQEVSVSMLPLTEHGRGAHTNKEEGAGELKGGEEKAEGEGRYKPRFGTAS